MFRVIQADAYGEHSNIIDRMFRLRKRVFFDKLKWEVTIDGDYERDRYDDLGPAYLTWTDSTGRRLYGSIRLLPTTGPTLLHDVFHDTFPEAAALVHPSIWEGTRMCADERLLATDFPGMSPNRAMCLMLLGLCEFALRHGISTLVSNYEPHMKRIYRLSGAELEELGRSTAHGSRPVCCGSFEVSEQVLRQMRAALKLDKPLFEPFARSAPLAA